EGGHVGAGEKLAPFGVGQALAIGRVLDIGGLDEDFRGDVVIADDGGHVYLGRGAPDFGADGVALVVSLNLMPTEFVDERFGEITAERFVASAFGFGRGETAERAAFGVFLVYIARADFLRTAAVRAGDIDHGAA